MALSATITWEVRYTGSDTNGGGFKTGASGTDYTLQDSPQLTVTDAACSGTTTVTSATGGFTSAMIGNVMYLSSGPGWYEITARTDTNTVTIDRAGPSASGMTCNVGGAFATPGRAGGVKVAGNDIYIKYNASSYTLTTSSANVSGGPVNDSTGGSSNTNTSDWIGYDITRTKTNTDANRPTISTGSVSSITILKAAADYITFRNITVDGNSQTATIGIDAQIGYGFVLRCTAKNCTSKGFNLGAGPFSCLFSSATGCSGTAGFYSNSHVNYVGCEAYNNTTTGFSLTYGDFAAFCISSGNTGGSSQGFNSNSAGYSAVNCLAYGNGSHGFDLDTSVSSTRVVNCISFNNSGSGYYTSAVRDLSAMCYCAGGSNVSGNYNSTNLTNVIGFVDLSTNDPFTNAASGDFTINVSSTGGALLNGAGYPGVMPRGTTTGYLDIGVAQHADPASSGIFNRIIQATNIGTY